MCFNLDLMTSETKSWNDILEDGWRVTSKKIEIDLLNDNSEETSALKQYKTENEDEVVILMKLPSKKD